MTPRHLPLLALSLLLAACAQQAAPTAAAPTPVRTSAAWAGPANAPVSVSGVLAFADEMKLSFKVGGVIRSVQVQEGERIRRGQQLAEIELAEIDAQVEQARQLADKATRDLQRGERLQAEQVISVEQLQDLRTQASLAAASRRAAEFNRRHASIVAPADGVVLRKLAEGNELVPAGQPVLVVAAAGSGVIAKAALADRELARLHPGDVARLSLDAFPGAAFTGKVTQVSRAADAATGLFPIEVQLDSPPAGAASGMVVKLTIDPAGNSAPGRVYVPIQAIVEGDGNRAFVYQVEAGRARRREVKVAFITAEAVALESGLAAGAAVVSEGALFLSENEAVRVLD